ncbi:UNVERIFIED_CONTAM: anti-anti-sigma factor [Williamsia faeni]
MHAHVSHRYFTQDHPRTVDNTALTVTTVQRQGMTILSVDGTVDLLTTSQLTDAVTAAVADHPRCLIIDLTNTAFLASTGMHALLTAHAAMAPSGHFGVVADGPSTARPMKLTGLDQTFTISPTVDDAIAAFTRSTVTDQPN